MLHVFSGLVSAKAGLLLICFLFCMASSGGLMQGNNLEVPQETFRSGLILYQRQHRPLPYARARREDLLELAVSADSRSTCRTRRLVPLAG